MAEYLVQDTSLIEVADAIRIKGETSENLVFPEGFVSAISEISTGVDTSDATASSSDILSGETAYVNGAKVTGNIETKTSSNLTASGATVTVPSGYYASNATKSVATATQATPSISVSSSGVITASATQSAGYVAAGTKSATKQLTVQAAKTVTPSTSAQTAVASGRYTTGAVEVAGDTDLKAANIKNGVNIFGITGSYKGAGILPEIYVKYPAGATCKCSKGSTVYTAGNTTGYWVFSGLTTGTWTLTITDPTGTNESVSSSVNITNTSQVVSVELCFGLVLVDGATLNSNYTLENYHANSSGTYVCEMNADYGGLYLKAPAKSDTFTTAYFEPRIDVANYSKFYVRWKAHGYANKCGLATSITTGSNVAQVFAASASISNPSKSYSDVKENTIDISSLTDSSYYFAVNTAGSGSSGYTGEIIIYEAKLFN